MFHADALTATQTADNDTTIAALQEIAAIPHSRPCAGG